MMPWRDLKIEKDYRVLFYYLSVDVAVIMVVEEVGCPRQPNQNLIS
jgi:hypothetical protein